MPRWDLCAVVLGRHDLRAVWASGSDPREPAWCGANAACTFDPSLPLSVCTCVAGYAVGSAGQCEDVDECQLGSHSCDDIPAACVNTTGGFSCVCPDGYEGDGVGDAGCQDVDECVLDTDGCSSAPEACQNSAGSFSCHCPAGYAGNGAAPGGCVDIDECGTNTDDCSALASCQNLVGGYQCECSVGYTGDGVGVSGCVDIDECAADTDDCSSDPDACANTAGSFRCQCPGGYTGDGVGVSGCVDIDECAANTDTCDDMPDACINLVGSYTCECPAGYGGWGGNCSDVNECQQDLDDCASASLAVCTNTTGSYECGCLPGYSGPGKGPNPCVNIDECAGAPDPCGGSGACADFQGGFLCAHETSRLDMTGYHACAILEDGTLSCWGRNSWGELGLGHTLTLGDNSGEVSVPNPVDVGTGRSVLSVAGGWAHTCALLDDGSVKCWGDSEFGQLGQDDKRTRGDGPDELGDNLPPITFSVALAVVDIAAGAYHTCGLFMNGSVRCWGRNDARQLGHNSDPAVGDEAGDMAGLRNVYFSKPATVIAAGIRHNCAILTDGAVECWGKNDEAQLGQGHTNALTTAYTVDVDPTYRATALALGGYHSCALLENGSVKCWGQFRYTATSGSGFPTLGDEPGEMGEALPTIDLGAGRTATAIAAGGAHTCALLDNGNVRCWGQNWVGQLGLEDGVHRAPEASASVNLGTGRSAIAIRAARSSTCALLDDRSIKCWGSGAYGVPAQGSTANVGDDVNEMGDSLPPISAMTITSWP